ncbi:MAG: copper chaperone PCu(A)C, partial [Chloroflexia bacterium]|nr:copper chaperone PCu(A)C [Chloroflexia bacterium]
VTRDVNEGESIPVTLTFERAGTVEVNAVVRQP